jgi:hypothetical protein
VGQEATRQVTAEAEGQASFATLGFRLSNGQERSIDLLPMLNAGPTVVASNVTPNRVTGPRSGGKAGFEITGMEWRP